MAGGSGTRFWPRSRHRTPKQLLTILGTRTMLAETVARLTPPISRDRIFVVTAATHADAVRAALPQLGASRILVEPEGRNTAAAIALAALRLLSRDSKAVMAVLPADHMIGDRKAFGRDLALALDTAEETGALVTIGIRPTYPETGYGYIRARAPLPGSRGRVSWVDAFIEKPNRVRARALLARGGVRWNAGIFAWRADVIVDALRTHAPTILEPLEAALAKRSQTALRRAYARLPSISIDNAVLERADRVAMVEARFPWSDVGSWAAVEPLWRSANNGHNAVRGRVVPVDSRGCVVDSPERLVALLGVEGLIVVDTPDAVLVCRKDRAQDVRLVVAELRRLGLERYL
jgi:mannose-1-phosphate guanylyltransferase